MSEVNSYLLREKTPNITLGANAAIGTAAATVDIVSHVGIIASAAGLTFTLPVPADLRSGRDFRITNAGVNPFTVGSKLIGANDYADFSFDSGTWHAEAPTTASGSDFWRTDPTAQMPDGVMDVADAIARTGQTKIDTNIAGDSGLTLDDLRSRNSAQLTAGDGFVTDTNMTAIGVDLNGKVRLSNALSSPDLRTTNANPQDYAAGVSYAFKQSSTVGLIGAAYPNIPTYVELETTRRYAQVTDFSGGPVIQRVFLEDGRSYYRKSTNGTTWDAWNLESKTASTFNLQDLLSLNGQAHVSKTGEVFWTNRFITMTAGSRTQEPSGYHDIALPAVGALIYHTDGTTRAVVAATAGDVLAKGGILLNAWESLWYRVPQGTANATTPGNLRIAYYPNNGNPANAASLLGVSAGNAEEWIRLVSRDDQNHYRFGTGDSCSIGGFIGTSNADTEAYYSASKSRAMGDGYFFSPGGNTAVPTAFGFSGTIRWINGGASGYVSGGYGYIQVANGEKAVGTPVFVMGGAARAWRLMTVAEKPGWFGGALRGTNPIAPAATTVVDLNDNEILCWIPDVNASPTAGSWYVFPYSGGNTVLPVNALPIASRQVTGADSTIQVLVGGMQYALKAGDATYTTTPADHYKDAKQRQLGIQFNGPAYCRFTTTGFFAGAAANGQLGSTDGVMLSWDTNRLMYGISDGYASFGNQYTWLEVPAAGTAIPVVSTNSNITRVVQTIGGHRYIPLGAWEALYWVPPAYIGGNTAADGDWVISYYGSANQHIPSNAVLIAKMFGVSAGSSSNKTRVKFADGSYMQPGVAIATATFAEYDHAQGSGDWRAVVAAGQTGPAMTVAVPAVAGIANQGAQYNTRVEMSDPRPTVVLDGGIAITANVPDGTVIGFMPGVVTQSSGQITSVTIRHAGNNAVPGHGFVTFNNGTIGGQQGTQILLYGASAANVTAANGGAHGASGFVSLFGLQFHHA